MPDDRVDQTSHDGLGRGPRKRAGSLLPRRLRGPAQRAFYRSSTVRKLVSAARRPADREAPDISHLTVFSEIANGPIQREEALFLYSVLRVLRPQTVVEIGFLNGRSAHNFLCALEPDARLYSFDIHGAEGAHALFGHDSRFTFRTRSQDELTPEDIDGRKADFVFLDASHELDLNLRTFARLLPLMAPDAILAIHDTGTIPRRFVRDGHYFLASDVGWVGDEREVMPDERAFMNWLLEEHPEFAQVHFHSRRTVRCGFTLLQRMALLPRPPELGLRSSG